MKNKRFITTMLSAVVASSVLLTACGSGSTTETGAAESTETAVTEVSEEADDAAQEENQGETEESSMETVAVGETLDSTEFMALLNLPVGGLAEIQELEDVEVVDDEEVSRIDRAMRAYTPSSDSLLINSYDNFYYYSQLDEEGQGIYDSMMMVCEDPVSDDNYNLYTTQIDPSSEEFSFEMVCAYLALVYDHPELFWIYNSSETSLSYATTGIPSNGVYSVYFSLSEPYTNYEEEMAAFNEAAEEFLSDIDTTASEEEIATQIHDKLAEMVTYDYAVAEKLNESGQDLAHTAYGALVADSDGNANYAVCDGYSLAYEYLCQQVGIDCIFIGGKAGSTEYDAGGHAWNLINLNGKWGEVDVTWDDSLESYDEAVDQLDHSSIEYQVYYETMNDSEYRDRLGHYLFSISTSRIRNYSPTEEDYYTTKDGRYSVCLMSESVHIRDSEDMPDQPMGALISLAPVAN